jgi:hypothetical protein
MMRHWLLAFLLLLGALPALALQAGGPHARDIATAQGLPLTPQMFGAVADGVADDTRAVGDWLASGKPLFCSGQFKLTHGVSVALTRGGGLSLQGAGRQLCKFILAAPDAGLTINGGTPDLYNTSQVVIHDVGLALAAILTRPALEIAYRGGSGATDPTLDLRNVVVKPVAPGYYAPTCLRLDNVRLGVAQAVTCEGHRGHYEPGSKGIVLTGDAQPVEVTLRDVNVYYMDEGIALEGTWQGVAISEAVCVPCRVGIHAEASDNNGVWLRVLDSHFNVEEAGIETVNIANVNVSGDFIYLNAVGPSKNPFRACIALTMLSQATMWSKVSGNACDGTQSQATPKYGVYIDSARKPASFLMEDRIEGNSFYALDVGVYLKTTTAVHVGSNTYSTMSKADVWNGSSGSGIFKNTQAAPAVPLPPGAN